jgi:hypothetical protein
MSNRGAGKLNACAGERGFGESSRSCIFGRKRALTDGGGAKSERRAEKRGKPKNMGEKAGHGFCSWTK